MLVDLKRRPADQIRGSKWLWRPLAFVNLVGPVSYFAWGGGISLVVGLAVHGVSQDLLDQQLAAKLRGLGIDLDLGLATLGLV